MKIYNQIQQRVNEQFIDAQLPKTGNKSPRTGYYFIKSLAYQPVGPTGQSLVAEANWKNSLQDAFVEDLTVQLAISNLMFDNADHPPLMEDEELIGKTLHIHGPVLDVKYFNGEPKMVIKAFCHYVDEPAKFINEQNAALYTVFANVTGGKSVYDTLLANSSYDLATALEWEADYGYSGDTLINESILGNEFDEDPVIEDAPDASEEDSADSNNYSKNNQ